jgi:DNA-binding beta-propeller fold protein YncE
MRSDEELRRLVSHRSVPIVLVMILARQTVRFLRRATLLLFAVGMLPLTSAPSKAQNAELPMLSLESKIVLGEVKGRIDHMAFDQARNRLFVAELENNSLGVVDLNERKVVHRITGLTEPQGVAYEPASDTLYVANGGDGSVRLYRGADYAETGRIALGDDADNIRIHPSTGQILVGYGAGAIATINPATRAKIADFRLPGHPESFQLDRKTNQVFVNVPRAKTIVVLDSMSGQRKAIWSAKEGGGNFPMALDEEAQHVIVAYRAPPRLAILSTGGQGIASHELCGDADDLFVDPKRARIYVSCGQGFLDVFDARDANRGRLARVPTLPGARTSYYVASLDRLFLAVRATSAQPASIWVYRPAP